LNYIQRERVVAFRQLRILQCVHACQMEMSGLVSSKARSMLRLLKEARMTRIFASGSTSKPVANDDCQRTALPDFVSLSDGKALPRHVRVAIVGTGFSGLGMAIQLKQHGYDDFIILEQASEVGGTWRDNTYPGCACDIPSHLYSFSFALNPEWSRKYSPQEEIWAYLRRCTERFAIEPHIRWNCTLLQARWNEAEQQWHLTTTRGQLTAAVLILGQGPLSEPSLPAIPGIEEFQGTLFHSAQWRHDYDLVGKRVAVIGTGASAVQFLPQIHPKVAHLTLFQRTPAWILPRLDQPVPAWRQHLFRLLPITQRLARARIYLRQELLALGFVYKTDLLKNAERLAKRHLYSQIQDPVLREKLTPHYAMGCKRIVLSDDFYPALIQPNVEVVTERIREVRDHHILTEDGREREVDAIICGTGFHVTDTQIPRCVYGRTGFSLAETWQGGISAYLGTTVAGFPNLFLLIGPNTGLGHNSMVYMIESQVAYILDCLRVMDRRHVQAVEVRSEIQEAFNRSIQERLQRTVWASGCASWYLDARGCNPTIWPGFTFTFRRKTRHFDASSYNLVPAAAPVANS
jgi:cation diffusion facilitator CzcD-associated flavoprotein CzcO